VAISLGLYISERNEGVFKDTFVTFSGSPSLQILKGNLRERYTQLRRAEWEMSTNLEAVFKLILNQATKHKISEDEMPTKILILSDMEFDAASSTRSSWYKNDEESEWNPTAQKMIKEMYGKAGYAMPQIIYWNIQSRVDNVPVSFNETGTALISGFSPSILKSVLKGEVVSPIQVMDETIMNERYSSVRV
jgi:hypothetical protein